MLASNVHFNVRPRYTPGSPAMVDRDTAEKVAAEEREFYAYALSGAWGERERQRALTLGLRGCAEWVRETRDKWEVLDLVTREKYERPLPSNKRKREPTVAYTALRVPNGLYAIGECQLDRRGCTIVSEDGVFDSFEEATVAASRRNERIWSWCSSDAYVLIRDAMSAAGFWPDGTPRK